MNSGLCLLALSLSSAAFAGQPDCINEAAQCFQINPLIIKAIIWQESNNRQNVVNINKNKTRDVGMMQINSIHFNSLKQKGISETDLKENSCANIFSGSWILNKVIKNNGYTWEVIGQYHSSTPYYRDRYVSKLISNLRDNSKTLNAITVPYQEGVKEKFSCS